MRIRTVAQIKRYMKGKECHELQREPQEGTRIREIYDILFANIGKPVDIGVVRGDDSQRIAALENYYGLDIRALRRKGEHALYVLAGEWFGKIYVDYIADSEEVTKMLLDARDALVNSEHPENLLPEGVHKLSKESYDTLKRVAEKGAAIAAKHLKRES